MHRYPLYNACRGIKIPPIPSYRSTVTSQEPFTHTHLPTQTTLSLGDLNPILQRFSLGPNPSPTPTPYAPPNRSTTVGPQGF